MLNMTYLSYWNNWEGFVILLVITICNYNVCLEGLIWGCMYFSFFDCNFKLSWYPKYIINNLIYPKRHQTGMTYTITRSVKNLHIKFAGKALAIRLPYFQNLSKLFICHLSIFYYLRDNFFHFHFAFLTIIIKRNN